VGREYLIFTTVVYKQHGSKIHGSITNALNRLDKAGAALSKEKAKLVVAETKIRFVEGNTRAWWMGFRQRAKTYSSAKHKPGQILPSGDKDYWFIPETEEEDLPVFALSRRNRSFAWRGSVF
jgi:hypothetical protein